MNIDQEMLSGTLKPDGTLELQQAPALAPGPVEVLIRPRSNRPDAGDTWWQFLERSRAALLTQGHTFRAIPEIDANRVDQREMDEARRQQLVNSQAPQK